MELVQAREEQLPMIIDMYEEVVRLMNENGIYQWGEDYPGPDLLRRDLEKGDLYLLMKEGKIAGAVVLNEEYEPEYNQISWQDRSGKFLVVHRLCVDPSFQGQGISKILLDEIEEFAKERGYNSIRLDTYIPNEKAMNLYENQGYERRGKFYFPTHQQPFMAFEKILDH